MTAEFHQRVRDIFDRAFELPEADRTAFVIAACGSNNDLLHEVQRLLAARQSSNSFLATGSSSTKKIGRYLVHEELGRGGMGVVYLAVDPVIGRSVALKVINLKALEEPSQAEFMRDRLFREARSCGRLFHPGIVIIFDVGQEGESAFIAMELVDGPSLQGMLANGHHLQRSEILRILRDTASALDYAHQHGIVHRDIKPGNIMVRKDGAVKVADFGIAKIISSSHTTVTSVIMGTPSYMSPEQIDGRSTDGRSDQFSLAVLAFELLAGVRPFRADSLPTMAHMIVYGERPSPRTINPSLPLTVDSVFFRAFARDANDRFANCSEFIRALQQSMEEPSPAPLPVVQEEQITARAKSPGRKFPLGAATATIAVALFAVALTYMVRNSLHGIHPTPGTSANNSEKAVAEVNGASPKPTSSRPSNTSGNAGRPPASGPPVIHQFRVEPASISTGEPATLKWDVTGADSVIIDHDVGRVSAHDTSVIGPTTSTTFALTASNSAGTSHRTAFVDVQPESIPPEVRARQLVSEAAQKRRTGNAEEAFALFSQAAEFGNVNAMVEVGESYRSGEGAPQDDNKAVSWFHRAADTGNTPGMVALGVMYLFGIDGGNPNEALANQWFQKAADRGDAAGLYNLAESYEKGRGVSKSLEQAIYLYGKSARLGNAEAQKRLSQLQTSIK